VDGNRGIAAFPNATAYSSYDYNGYRPSPGAATQYQWTAPPEAQRVNYDVASKAWRNFKTLGELAAATGQEAHGVEVDYDIFEDLRAPAAGARHAVYHAQDLSFRLKAGGKAVDKGVALPNVNDGYSGQAPDLGAIEAGQPEPVYGPRGRSRGAFYR
jgi:hypothetical protein